MKLITSPSILIYAVKCRNRAKQEHNIGFAWKLFNK